MLEQNFKKFAYKSKFPWSTAVCIFISPPPCPSPAPTRMHVHACKHRNKHIHMPSSLSHIRLSSITSTNQVEGYQPYHCFHDCVLYHKFKWSLGNAFLYSLINISIALISVVILYSVYFVLQYQVSGNSLIKLVLIVNYSGCFLGL